MRLERFRRVLVFVCFGCESGGKYFAKKLTIFFRFSGFEVKKVKIERRNFNSAGIIESVSILCVEKIRCVNFADEANICINKLEKKVFGQKSLSQKNYALIVINARHKFAF